MQFLFSSTPRHSLSHLSQTSCSPLPPPPALLSRFPTLVQVAVFLVSCFLCSPTTQSESIHLVGRPRKGEKERQNGRSRQTFPARLCLLVRKPWPLINPPLTPTCQQVHAVSLTTASILGYGGLRMPRILIEFQQKPVAWQFVMAS